MLIFFFCFNIYEKLIFMVYKLLRKNLLIKSNIWIFHYKTFFKKSEGKNGSLKVGPKNKYLMMKFVFQKTTSIQNSLLKKKSRIRETKHLSTNADSSTDTTVGWTKNNRKPIFFEKRKKIIQNAKTQNGLEICQY